MMRLRTHVFWVLDMSDPQNVTRGVWVLSGRSDTLARRCEMAIRMRVVTRVKSTDRLAADGQIFSFTLQGACKDRDILFDFNQC
jgi:hypothetical protein